MSSLSEAHSRHSPARPTEPPPYPGRSVIINYDYDDPEHWKNKLDKLQILAELRQSLLNGCLHRSPAAERTGPAMTPAKTLSSPVAAGAALTLAELKRKQMCKRRARLLAVGEANSPNGEDDYSNNSYETLSEEDVDSAEASLQLRLRRMLAKENLTDEYDVDVHVSAQAVPVTPAPDTPHDNDSLHMDALSPTGEQQLHQGHTPLVPPRRSLSPNYSKYHFYGPKSPAIPARKSTTSRRVLSETEFKETFENKTQMFETKQITRNIAGSSNYSITSCPPFSPENGQSESSEETAYWEQGKSFAANRGRNVLEEQCDRYVGEEEGDVESMGGERRASSDEGFGGNLREDDGNLEEVLPRKQVLALCDMQLQLLKALAASKEVPRKAERNGHREAEDRYGTIRRQKSQRSDDSVREVEMSRRCRMLEDHIGELTKNIEYLQVEIQNQQASLRHFELNQRPRVRFADDYDHMRRRSVAPPPEEDEEDSFDESAANPRTVPTQANAVPASAPSTLENVTFTNPERVTKLTRPKAHQPFSYQEQSPETQAKAFRGDCGHLFREIRALSEERHRGGIPRDGLIDSSDPRFFGQEPPLVRLFLRKLGYEKYAKLFEIEKIGLNELPYMTEDRLRRLGVPMGPRTRILREAQLVMKLDRNPNIYLV